MQKQPPEFSRASTVARRIGPDTRTVIAAAERGELPGLVPIRIGRLVMFRTEAVERFLAGAAQQGSAA